MNKDILVKYIRLVLESTKDARVPNQLIDDTDETSSEKKKDEVEDVVEFSGCGAIAGYTAPLGMNISKKNKVVKNKFK